MKPTWPAEPILLITTLLTGALPSDAGIAGKYTYTSVHTVYTVYIDACVINLIKTSVAIVKVSQTLIWFSDNICYIVNFS